MDRNERVELSPEELEAVNGAGFLDDAWEFGKGLWEKTKNVVKKLQNWG